ncbi:RNA polymerase subunit sigma-70 [Campylobacter jejuni]|nr:RNA polymerase subunit sigma-70 [Campylobacter jejuni]EDP7137556.1 RNA polymerase subunit sigma-70 [Campylobacter jejuni]EHD2747224.1 RNA polymerase subunit sigma-70 [Campylobacter jejuni]
MTFEEIAKELGISLTRVHQIYKHAIKKLRSPKNKDKWLAIFETLDLIEQEKTKRNNLIQGVDYDNND